MTLKAQRQARIRARRGAVSRERRKRAARLRQTAVEHGISVMRLRREGAIRSLSKHPYFRLPGTAGVMLRHAKRMSGSWVRTAPPSDKLRMDAAQKRVAL